jgi:alkanesulfonate monooxygenase SsuD/methylene tetrahydromethanopterin reductase-like flavin-dependent oxidoreductase (luciferase family)
MRHAIYVPLFGALSDPHAITDIAAAAEQAGWDGLFVWDNLCASVESG